MVYFYLDINSSYIIENSLQLLHPGAMFSLDTSLFEAVKMLNDQLVAV